MVLQTQCTSPLAVAIIDIAAASRTLVSYQSYSNFYPVSYSCPPLNLRSESILTPLLTWPISPTCRLPPLCSHINHPQRVTHLNNPTSNGLFPLRFPINTSRNLAMLFPLLFRQSRLLRTSFPTKTTTRYRTFSNTALRRVMTADFSKTELGNLKIDRERLWRDLHYTCQWGQGERWGE